MRLNSYLTALRRRNAESHRLPATLRLRLNVVRVSTYWIASAIHGSSTIAAEPAAAS